MSDKHERIYPLGAVHISRAGRRLLKHRLLRFLGVAVIVSAICYFTCMELPFRLYFAAIAFSLILLFFVAWRMKIFSLIRDKRWEGSIKHIEYDNGIKFNKNIVVRYASMRSVPEITLKVQRDDRPIPMAPHDDDKYIVTESKRSSKKSSSSRKKKKYDGLETVRFYVDEIPIGYFATDDKIIHYRGALRPVKKGAPPPFCPMCGSTVIRPYCGNCNVYMEE